MKEQTLIQRYNELIDIQQKTNCIDVRSPDNFYLSLKQYDFGARNTYIPKDAVYNEKLQDSRGIVQNDPLMNDKDLNNFISLISKNIDSIEESDIVRIEELKPFIDSSMKNSFCEIGFRIPKLLKYYENAGYLTTKGYDISRLNVNVAKHLGYDCDVHDLNDTTTQLTENSYDLLLCYHVLEHTHDPVKSFGKLANSLKKDGLIHIEIPIEPGIPRLRYGHLIALESGDLASILSRYDFKILSISKKTHSNGPDVERIVARK